jgi:hypothetical protein
MSEVTVTIDGEAIPLTPRTSEVVRHVVALAGKTRRYQSGELLIRFNGNRVTAIAIQEWLGMPGHTTEAA